ncbi:amidase family protein [candidate division CSSED10-310 bacterium]|uniref:Amidase family protein n=1 Tax=candidate division CSSED10-310 bacterium TaxID=2855610 RepID=A0ABV6Z6T3_UNCC1
MKKKKTATAYRDDVLGTMDGVELALNIAQGELKRTEVIEAAIARAQKINPVLNAIVIETFEEALNAVDGVSGPFAGVPSFIKDNDNVKGLPTTHGSLAVPKKPAVKSSAFATQYKSLGFVILGKSALPEFGLTATTESTANGATRNPWHLNYSPGGSSGGAAALVASGVVPIAHANDGGGSIRIPASCCGLVGLKASRHRLLAIEASERLPIQIATHGVVSRTVRDTAHYYAAAEKLFRNPDLPEIGLVQHAAEKRLKIGLFTKGFDFVSDVQSQFHTAHPDLNTLT